MGAFSRHRGSLIAGEVRNNWHRHCRVHWMDGQVSIPRRQSSGQARPRCSVGSRCVRQRRGWRRQQPPPVTAPDRIKGSSRYVFHSGYGEAFPAYPRVARRCPGPTSDGMSSLAGDGGGCAGWTHLSQGWSAPDGGCLRPLHWTTHYRYTQIPAPSRWSVLRQASLSHSHVVRLWGGWPRGEGCYAGMAIQHPW
jgi:hypothetical protein